MRRRTTRRRWCKAKVVQLVKVNMSGYGASSSGRRPRLSARYPYNFGSGAVHGHRSGLDMPLMYAVIYLTDGSPLSSPAVARCQGRRVAGDGQPQPAGRPDRGSALPDRRLLRCAGSRPGQVRDVATRRGRRPGGRADGGGLSDVPALVLRDATRVSGAWAGGAAPPGSGGPTGDTS